MDADIRPGSRVTYCGVEYGVSSIYKGEAELTTLSGVTVGWIRVSALHKITEGKRHNPGTRRPGNAAFIDGTSDRD